MRSVDLTGINAWEYQKHKAISTSSLLYRKEVSLETLVAFAPSRSCAVIVTVAYNLFLKNQFLSVSDYTDCYPELKPLTQKGTTDVFDTLAISDPKMPKIP